MAQSAHARLNLLLALADDELILGHRHSEWTGWAPTVEADLAFSSIAQDEMAHAQLLYSLVKPLDGRDPNELALGRHPGEYRQATFCEHPNSGPSGRALEIVRGPGVTDDQGPTGDWAYSLARQYLYDTADDLRTESLMHSEWGELADAVGIIRLEEAYHLEHARLWLSRLVEHSPDTRSRIQSAFDSAASDAASVFAPVWGEEILIHEGVLPHPWSQLLSIWEEVVGDELSRWGLTPPKFPHDSAGGRTGSHSADFLAMWEDMTGLYREHAGASW